MVVFEKDEYRGLAWVLIRGRRVAFRCIGPAKHRIEVL
jgi:hypothetical protein